MTFKIGDRVVFVEAIGNHFVGDLATITSINHDGPYYRVDGEVTGNTEEYIKLVEDGQMFKIGDKVKIVKNTSNSINTVGDVGVITEFHSSNKECVRVTVEGNTNYGNFHKFEDLEKVVEVEYEDQWHLNDGKVTIPDDADKLEKDGSVVAFRKVKFKPFEMGEIVKSTGNSSYITYRFINYKNNNIDSHLCNVLSDTGCIYEDQKVQLFYRA